jgi:glycosyltransferase involved in cell wall biosynthesis
MTRHIALSGLFLDYPFSGTWTYTRNLVRELPRLDPEMEYTLWTRRSQLTPCSMRVARAPSPFPPHPARVAWRERLDKLYWEVVAWPWAARRADLLHALHFAAPIVRPAPLIVTVHDVIPLRLPGYVRNWSARWYIRLMRQTTRHAQAIITVSHHARGEIAAALDYPPERIYVTPEAPDPALAPVRNQRQLAEVQHRYGLPERYLLYLGGSERRKNVEMLVRAWAHVATNDTTLVIVGTYPPTPDAVFPDIPGLVQKLGMSTRVHLVPKVNAEDLAAVYSGALAFCFPSLYEGFGLPPLEAMACGVPVLCSDATSLPETAGGGAELLPADDERAWTQAIERIIADEVWRHDLIERGRRHVAQFSWYRTAKETVAVYKAVLQAD